jgi:hypothetical protein
VEPRRRTDDAFKRFARDVVDAHAPTFASQMSEGIFEEGGR